jgi:DNA-binding response OmpR family regulator
VPKNVLAIDDNFEILQIVKFFLEGDGYSVKTSLDPVEGIKIAKQGGVDLIILDIMMPVMNGYQVYEELHKEEKTAQIPVIMLTARGVIETTPKAFFYGLYGVLAKPFTKRKLLDTVANILKTTEEGAAKASAVGDDTRVLPPIAPGADSGNPKIKT